jgi:hypothetical protein
LSIGRHARYSTLVYNREGPTRDVGLRVLMAFFKVYDKDNVEAEAQ